MENLAFRTRSLIIIHKGFNQIQLLSRISIQSDDVSSERTQMTRVLTGGERTEKQPARRPWQKSRYEMKTWSSGVPGEMVGNGQRRTLQTKIIYSGGKRDAAKKAHTSETYHTRRALKSL